MSGPTYEKRVRRNCEAIRRACDRIVAESPSTYVDSEVAAIRNLVKDLLEASESAEVVPMGGESR